MPSDLMFYFVVGLALLFEFVNGWTDAPNSIATVVSTRVLRPMSAVLMAAILNLAGAALTGTAVAKVVSEGIITLDLRSGTGLPTLAAALIGASVWSMAAQRFGIPTSESHGLVAGLLGAGIAVGGFDVVVGSGTNKVLFGLVTSPLAGFTVGLLLMVAIYWLFQKVRLGIVRAVFGKAQILSAGFMAFSHGSNDGQKTMGILALALFVGGRQPGATEPEITFGIILLAATVMGIGTAVGGWRVVHTLGSKMTKLEPVQGFAAETSAAGVILAASSLGIPISTTHAIGASIMGVGATKRLSAVRWGVAGHIVAAWVLTWPGCGLIAYTVSKGMNSGTLGWGPFVTIAAPLAALLPAILVAVGIKDLLARHKHPWEPQDIVWVVASVLIPVLAPLAWLTVGKRMRAKELDEQLSLHVA